jgi:hypothetical protein
VEAVDEWHKVNAECTEITITCNTTTIRQYHCRLIPRTPPWKHATRSPWGPASSESSASIYEPG